MSAGDTRLGWVVFKVPEGAVIERFTLALDSGFATAVGQWRVGIGAPTDPAPAVSVPTAGVGAAITLTGAKSLKMGVTVKAVVDNAPSAKYSKPKAGNRYFAVQLELANTGTVVYSDSPTNRVTLIDTAGQMWDTTYGETGAGPGFAGSVTIAPDDSRVGWLVFEVPVDQPITKLQVILDSGFADVVGEWSVAA